MREVDEKISTAKVEMRKLPLQEKVTKNAEIKRLQQEVQTLHEQEQSREVEVETHQSEAKRITDFIQLVQQILQGIV